MSDFQNNYNALSSCQKKILQLIAVASVGIKKTCLRQCIKAAGIRAPDGKLIMAPLLNEILDNLKQMNLLHEKYSEYTCSPSIIAHASSQAFSGEHTKSYVSAIHANHLRQHSMPRIIHSEKVAMRDFNIAYFIATPKIVAREYKQLVKKKFIYAYAHPLAQKLMHCNSFIYQRFLQLPEEIQADAFDYIFSLSFWNQEPSGDAFALLRKRCLDTDNVSSKREHALFIIQLLLRGNLKEAQKLVGTGDGLDLTLRACLTFFAGGDAVDGYEEALLSLKNKQSPRSPFVHFGDLNDMFYTFALIKSGSPISIKKAAAFLNKIRSSGKMADPYYIANFGICMNWYFSNLNTEREATITNFKGIFLNDVRKQSTGMEAFFEALVSFWTGTESEKIFSSRLKELNLRVSNSGYTWIKKEIDLLIERLDGKKATETMNPDTPSLGIMVDAVRPKEAWMLALDALIKMDSKNGSEEDGAEANGANERMAWGLTEYDEIIIIEPREQKRNAKGRWTKGRKVALKHLHGHISEFSYLTPQDLNICSYIKYEYIRNSYGYGEEFYTFNLKKALLAMVGHPNVFWVSHPEVPVEVSQDSVELTVKKIDQTIHISFSPEITKETKVLVIKKSENQIVVYETSAAQRNIATAIGEHGLIVPNSGAEHAMKAISKVAPMVTIQSDLNVECEHANEVDPDTKLYVRLSPSGNGLRVQVFVKPLALGNSYYRPGVGGLVVIAEVNGVRTQTTRDLDGEKQHATELSRSCPTLIRHDEIDGEWALSDMEDCLECVAELKELSYVILEWPQGELFSIRQAISAENLHLNIKRRGDWFSLSGDLKLEDKTSLDVSGVLNLLDQSPGRFLKLKNGEFLALTHRFRKHLDELRSISEVDGKAVRFHPLAISALEELSDDLGKFKTDKHWKEHLKRLHVSREMDPKIPSTLQCELRDYQVDGFRWLARLAHWGVGACLADDMGLGKTVQALTVILNRASSGPTLIVAPTSVCMNWEVEARRFTPTLKVKLFGAGDRKAALKSLGAFDVLVCSYGLLQQETKALSKIKFETIVLDEAQAIKNMATKRSKAAMLLQGEFKIVTTGTPIENHLGELWNLFRFINPGLLGSIERFNKRFANPIEKNRDTDAQRRLKKLIRPFMLRRLKSHVLDELPPRTEILLHVDMSKEEIAFYEALRRAALEKLADGVLEDGKRNMTILAEIMKLRRACCHGRLVMNDAPEKSSKLEVLGHTLDELLANRHKALVFSQFVTYLDLIREFIEKRGISYQYLDGSTPMKERKRRVDAFQAGEGDLFLISLKAGGQGLNLTAADYVIHMDPWWNPAVEDQASDRVHRIGQKRPVTIYRMVTTHTIEEKIVELHGRKRDLAEGLLEGGDMSGRVSTKELLQLIRDET